MEFLENDLEDIIYNANAEAIRARGLKCYSHHLVLRQIPLGKYGVADLVTMRIDDTLSKIRETVNRCITITVYELKQKKISASTLIQAGRYVKGLTQCMDEWHRMYPLHNTNFRFNIVLIGRTLDIDSDFIYLIDFIDNLSVFTYGYSAEGIRFKEHLEYALKNEAL